MNLSTYLSFRNLVLYSAETVGLFSDLPLKCGQISSNLTLLFDKNFQRGFVGEFHQLKPEFLDRLRSTTEALCHLLFEFLK